MSAANANVWSLWHALDSVFPMPISRTRDRICRWLADAQDAGLIDPQERSALLAADAEDREQTMRARRDLGMA